ncbi:hypothetical protein B0H13DRAFT_1880584 [Mycena leptocephala]|nr:hypothetical protein B0H13DRAFT_1880584 [Mycena leptocephala]
MSTGVLRIHRQLLVDADVLLPLLFAWPRAAVRARAAGAPATGGGDGGGSHGGDGDGRGRSGRRAQVVGGLGPRGARGGAQVAVPAATAAAVDEVVVVVIAGIPECARPAWGGRIAEVEGGLGLRGATGEGEGGPGKVKDGAAEKGGVSVGWMRETRFW